MTHRREAVQAVIDSEEERRLFDERHGRVIEEAGWLPGGQDRNVQLFEAAGPRSPR
jgi:hypothetical protein